MYFYSDDEEDSDDSSIVSYKSNDFEPFYGGSNPKSSSDNDQERRSNIKLHLYAYMYISDCDLTINSENIDKILKILKDDNIIKELLNSTEKDPDLKKSVESYLEKINLIYKK